MMDVYQKLKQAKMAENIVIDAAFKASLREKILIQAQSLSYKKPENSFFKKWRFPFAMVPALLLMLIVALQATRFPVTIPSQSVNPDTSYAPSDLKSQSQQEEENSIQTFAGSSVMPKKYEEKQMESIPQQENTFQKEVNNMPSQQNQTSITPSAPQFYVQPESAPMPIENLQPLSPAITSNTLMDNTGFQDANAPQNITPLTQSTETTQNQNSPQISDALTTDNQGEQQNSPLRQQATSTQTQNMNATLPMPQVKTFSFPVFYQTSFSADEKTLLNQTIIPGLISTENPASVSVSEDRAQQILAVKLTFSDGNSKTYYYKKDFSTQQWMKISTP